MSNVPHLTKALLSTAEAADAAGMSVATINRWADAGKLPVALRAPGIRGARFFRRKDVEAIARDEGSATR